MRKPQILITGAAGQVGQELRYLAAEFPQFQLIGLDRQGLDISDEEAVLDSFGQHEIDFCINCAAYTAVDKAESEAEKAIKQMGKKASKSFLRLKQQCAKW